MVKLVSLCFVSLKVVERTDNIKRGLTVLQVINILKSYSKRINSLRFWIRKTNQEYSRLKGETSTYQAKENNYDQMSPHEK